jgi:raffinose/stachyose/melibiose transport system permease protein
MKHHRLWYAVFLAPALLLFLLIYAYPVMVVFWTSFFDWKLLKPMEFVGLDNYVRLFTEDREFGVALRNTAVWVLLQSTVHVGIGILIALVLSKKPFGWKFVRTAYMIPIIISSAARAILFLNIFNPQMGLVNSAIRGLGFTNFTHNWYYDPHTSFWTVTLGWLLFASTITIIVMAEISTIPDSLLEAARIDGANSLQIDWFIILPMLRNIIGTSVILAATSMLKEFEMIFLTSQGGPNSMTLNLPLYLYKNAMTLNNYGYANSIGTFLIICGLVIVLLTTRLFRFGQTD